MCGITGFFSPEGVSSDFEAELKIATERLTHRGPDNSGTFNDEYCYLGQTRLSIIDTSEAGHQPMKDVSGRYVIVYNGECYNHPELREILIKSGVKFSSASDTETVLYWLIKEGEKGLESINGFFSIALYDSVEKSLLLARDRYGIKPLHYKQSENSLSFSSELRAIIDDGKKYALNKNSARAYSHLNYIPSPFSIYEEIQKVRPGHFLKWSKGEKIKTESYYSLPVIQKKKSTKRPEEKILELLDNSVERRLISDVPLGCFLSGGLDSSIISALACRHIEKLNTYTVVFKDNRQYDESVKAKKVASHLNTEHTEIEITKEDLLKSAREILSNVDEPFADSSAIAVNCLSKAVRKDIKVALSGDGGDELFLGYHKHLATYLSGLSPLRSTAKTLSAFSTQKKGSREAGIRDFFRKWQRFSNGLSLDMQERYWLWAGYRSELENPFNSGEELNHQEFLHQIIDRDISSIEDTLLADMKMVLEGDMLVKTDRMSMQNSLEVRVPMLDHELVDFVHALPINSRISMGRKKHLLKEIGLTLLPKEIINQKKQGFEVPLKIWLNEELRDELDALTNSELIKEQSIFNINQIHEWKKKLKMDSSDNAEYSLWNIMIFNSWWKNAKHKLK